MGIFVGAYAAAPSTEPWNMRLEAEFLRGLADNPGIKGLEVSWAGRLHPHDEPWLLATVAPTWQLVITDVAHTGARVATDPNYGLASISTDGRSHAMLDAHRMHEAVKRANDTLGRSSVIAIEVHSAPSTPESATAVARQDAFTRSLGELAEWEWEGTTVLVEHCDAAGEGRRFEKGYLSLACEIEAIRNSGADIGLTVNWGRSAIELRDPDLVVDHISAARQANILRSLVFSGTAEVPTAYGPAWADAHLPFDGDAGERFSLLTDARASAALAAAGQLDWVGVKMGWRPMDAPVGDRIAMVDNAVQRIATARLTTRPRTRPVRAIAQSVGGP